MKKAVLLLLTFSFALMLGIGITVSLPSNAHACQCEFPYVLIPTCDTGPNCTNPAYPYYMYKQSVPCPGCYVFNNCYNGVKAGC